LGIFFWCHFRMTTQDEYLSLIAGGYMDRKRYIAG